MRATPEYVAALESLKDEAEPFTKRQVANSWPNYHLHDAWEEADRLQHPEKYPSDPASPLCVRCDYGPNHDSEACRGWRDADEPCRNVEPDEYEDWT